MRGSKYRDADRVRALGIAVVEGPRAASEATGIPERTIYAWQESEEFAELRKRTKEQVAEEWWAIVQRGFRRTADLLDGATDAQKVAVATAIIADKMLLIRGEATGRIESVNLSDDLPADVKRELRARLDRSVRGESELGRTEGDPVRAGAPVDS